MHMKNNEEFIKMMNGGYGHFTQYELWFIFSNLHELEINTISVQKTSDAYFTCIVDKPTTWLYQKQKMERECLK